MNQPPLNPDALEAAARAVNAAHTYDYLTPWDVLVNSGDKANQFRVKRDREYARAAVSAYLAAALPEVTEREQLTALPDKIVLEDRRGTIWQKINGTWYTPGSKHDYSDQSVMLPARVLYRPEVKP